MTRPVSIARDSIGLAEPAQGARLTTTVRVAAAPVPWVVSRYVCCATEQAKGRSAEPLWDPGAHVERPAG